MPTKITTARDCDCAWYPEWVRTNHPTMQAMRGLTSSQESDCRIVVTVWVGHGSPIIGLATAYLSAAGDTYDYRDNFRRLGWRWDGSSGAWMLSIPHPQASAAAVRDAVSKLAEAVGAGIGIVGVGLDSRN
jgi:hypothetical protein